MKYAPFLIFVLLIFINCKKDISDSSKETISRKDKFLVESDRDVESLDSTIIADFEDLEMIQVRIFPSFDQGHSIRFNKRDRKIEFFQITQKLNRTEDYYRIPEEEREYHLNLFMKKNSSKNFQTEITKEEEELILKEWSKLKQANYKAKKVKMMDGASFYTEIYERDTIALINTNSPSSHHTKLIKTLFDLSEKYAKDSITIRNINRLKEYL